MQDLNELLNPIHSEAFFDAAGVCALENCNSADVATAQAALKSLCAKCALILDQIQH